MEGRGVRALAVGLALIATPAAAQVDFGRLQQPNYAGDAMRSYQMGLAARQQREAMDRERADAEWARQDYENRQAAEAERQRHRVIIAEHFSAGRCAEAAAAAASDGDLAVVTFVRQNCKPAP